MKKRPAAEAASPCGAHSPLRPLSARSAALLAALVLAGCGGGGGAATTRSDETASARAAAERACADYASALDVCLRGAGVTANGAGDNALASARELGELPNDMGTRELLARADGCKAAQKHLGGTCR